MVIEIALCSIIMAFFIIFELSPMFHQKQWKAFWVYVILIAFSYVIHTLYAMNVNLPSPDIPIKKLVSFIFGLQD